MSEGQVPMIFIIYPVPPNRIEYFISLVWFPERERLHGLFYYFPVQQSKDFVRYLTVGCEKEYCLRFYYVVPGHL